MSHHFPDFSGKIIDQGRLQFLRLIGRGGYSVVYQALDSTAMSGKPRYYSVKCLSHPSTDQQREMQSREFSYLGLVSQHPHVTTLHKILSDDTFVYVVLDYCPGDLFSAITRGEFKHKDERIKTTFSQLADALEWCHLHGIFHRDLKPENVLCDKDNIYLADFGLATSDAISSKFGVGSTHYMSPESLGDEIKLKQYCCKGSDVWSLGVILCNLISGRNPWRVAKTTDSRFSNYLHNPDSLRKNLGLSTAAANTLHRVFTINPYIRIPLAVFAQEVATLDSFYDDHGDTVAHASGIQSGPTDVTIIVENVTPQSAGSCPSNPVKSLEHDPSDWGSPLLENDDTYYALGAPLPAFNGDSGAKDINPLTKFDNNTASRYNYKSRIHHPSALSSFLSPPAPRDCPGSVHRTGYDSGASSAGPLTPPERGLKPPYELQSLDKCIDSMYHQMGPIVSGEELLAGAVERLLVLSKD